MHKLTLSAALPALLAAAALSPLACNSGAESEENTPAEAQGFGHCTYTNKFSKAEECRQYEGSGWTKEAVEEDCLGQSGALEEGECAYEEILGTCVLEDGDQTTLVISPGNDGSACGGNKLGCETFAGGTWVPEEPCKGDVPDSPSGTVFQPPALVCKEPVAGEAEGQSEDGKVCTWGMISGCTEPGRKFVDYASCDDVYTQRPYYAAPAPPGSGEPDARMSDPAYVKELNWVKEQVEACACVCCHQDSVTPEGAGVWDIEGEGNWINTFTPYGLAFAGGFIPSWPLGAYPAEENNGFDRSVTGLPTTDVARMQAFFAAELSYRGKSAEDFESYEPTPAFFYEQHTFEPAECEAGDGVNASGEISWSGGSARYVFVLEKGADNPGVPPNLDEPEGTIWKLDVKPESSAVKSGEVVFGQVPGGATQAVPVEGSPAGLVSGETYYLYVVADVGIPITRCLFTYEGK
ncbi:MAG: proteinase inhibitor [Polyangiaceae bacterium]